MPWREAPQLVQLFSIVVPAVLVFPIRGFPTIFAKSRHRSPSANFVEDIGTVDDKASRDMLEPCSERAFRLFNRRDRYIFGRILDIIRSSRWRE